MNHSRKIRRGGVVSFLAGVVATAMLATGAASTAAPLTSLNASASAAPTSGTVLKNDFGKATSTVEGTFGKAGTVTGEFKPRRFKVNDAGDLMAVGKLTATLTKASGKVVGTDSQRVALPVSTVEGESLRTAAVGDCDILNLVLGPLDLDLLGLQVHLDQVVLNIVAASGAGNLLGNLLCAVAGLLDADGVLTEISQILNSILAILRL